MSRTAIEWCNIPGYLPEVWNPVTGCARVSPGCDNCYAIRQSHRFAGVKGSKFEGVTTSGYDVNVDWSGKVVCHEDLLDMPLRWRKPRAVFVNSMSDLFHDDVPIEFIAKVWATMTACPQHVFMILTKRPLRMKQILNVRTDRYTAFDRMHPNVWLGVSCENQAMADQRIPHLLKTPAAVRFVSYEPALGPISFENRNGETMLFTCQEQCPCDGTDCENENECLSHSEGLPHYRGIDWVICGGESGPGARPMHPDWARSVRDQCKAAGVKYFFKQWGEWAPWEIRHAGMQNMRDVMYLNNDGTFTDTSNGKLGQIVKVGKKEAGRLLDGVEHSEWPNA